MRPSRMRWPIGFRSKVSFRVCRRNSETAKCFHVNDFRNVSEFPSFPSPACVCARVRTRAQGKTIRKLGNSEIET
jgi:hypothetical protein